MSSAVCTNQLGTRRQLSLPWFHLPSRVLRGAVAHRTPYCSFALRHQGSGPEPQAHTMEKRRADMKFEPRRNSQLLPFEQLSVPRPTAPKTHQPNPNQPSNSLIKGCRTYPTPAGITYSTLTPRDESNKVAHVSSVTAAGPSSRLPLASETAINHCPPRPKRRNLKLAHFSRLRRVHAVEMFATIVYSRNDSR